MRPKPPLAAGRQPVIGHTRALLDGPLDALQRWGHTDDPLVRVQIPGRELTLVTTPAATKQVLSADPADYRKAEIVRERLGTLQGGSLVLREGEQWQQRRETLQPAFARGRVAAMGSTTTEYTSRMVDGWPAQTPIRIVQEIQDLVLGILADALFGLELGEENPIEAAADDILARMDLGSVSAYLPEWVPTPTNLRFRRAVSTLHDRLDRVVDQQSRAEPEPKNSLLSIMLAAGLPPEAIRDELIALLFAGYDSTATTLSCTLALIGSHPTVQSELRAELDSVLGGQPPTPEDLSALSAATESNRERRSCSRRGCSSATSNFGTIQERSAPVGGSMAVPRQPTSDPPLRTSRTVVGRGTVSAAAWPTRHSALLSQ